MSEADAAAAAIDTLVRARPVIVEGWGTYLTTVWNGAVDPVVLELCRLRTAQLMGSATDFLLRIDRAIDAGLDEDKIADIPNWPFSPRFTETERACLAYAESFTIDAAAITDDDVARLVEHIDRAQLVTLTVALAQFHGVTRFRIATGAPPPDGPTRVDPTGRPSPKEQAA